MLKVETQANRVIISLDKDGSSTLKSLLDELFLEQKKSVEISVDGTILKFIRPVSK